MNELFNLQDKVVVMTGGTGVLGSTIVHALAKQGCKVVVIGRDEQKMERILSKIRQDNGDCFGVRCDVLDKAGLLAAKEQILAHYDTIDILINGAGGNSKGATTSPNLSFFQLDQEALEFVTRLNFMGSLLPTQVFGDVFVEKKKGVILNISSMASLRPLTNVLGYGAAKASINNFTQWLAVHMNQNYSTEIRVNAIAPGFFLTEQNRFLLTDEKTGEFTPRGHSIIEHTPMERFGEPEDLVGTVLWLVSDASKFVNGAVIPVDGGFAAFSGV